MGALYGCSCTMQCLHIGKQEIVVYIQGANIGKFVKWLLDIRSSARFYDQRHGSCLVIDPWVEEDNMSTYEQRIVLSLQALLQLLYSYPTANPNCMRMCPSTVFMPSQVRICSLCLGDNPRNSFPLWIRNSPYMISPVWRYSSSTILRTVGSQLHVNSSGFL